MKFQHIVSGFVGCFFLFVALPLEAADDKDAIKYRVRVMKGIGANMGSIGDILKGKVEYKNLIVNYAKAMNESAKTVTTIFKQDTSASSKKNRAKNDIWAKWGDFEKAANDFVAASAGVAEAAESGDMAKIGPAMKKLGGSCGGCHKPFRKKKKK